MHLGSWRHGKAVADGTAGNLEHTQSPSLATASDVGRFTKHSNTLGSLANFRSLGDAPAFQVDNLSIAPEDQSNGKASPASGASHHGARVDHGVQPSTIASESILTVHHVNVAAPPALTLL